MKEKQNKFRLSDYIKDLLIECRRTQLAKALLELYKN